MIHTIQNQFLSVSVCEHGAELQSIKGADGTEYLWQGDPAYWSDRAINLFPYVARLTEGKYRLDGKLYEMPIHGLAPYSRFEMCSWTENTMVFELRETEESLRQYPRRFRFRIRYHIEGKTLNIAYEVENRDDKMLFFGLGGHPGFRVPMVAEKRFEDYFLSFSKPCEPKRIVFTPSCFLDGTLHPFSLKDRHTLSLNHTLFDEDAIVLIDMASQVTLETAGDDHKITVSYPQMPYLGLWHMPRTDAPYICIEPWCSLPSKEGEITDMETQTDLISLEPGGLYHNKWQIEIG